MERTVRCQSDLQHLSHRFIYYASSLTSGSDYTACVNTAFTR